MAQKLVLPINNCAFSAGYKNAAYLKQQGYPHYGVDLYSLEGELTVYACGDGEVIACGLDGWDLFSRLGNSIVIVYKNVELHDGTVKDIACRMFHFSKINVKVGQKVTKNTIVGLYGNTGGTTVLGKPMGYHLHLEFDSDVEYPTYAVGISRNGNVIKKGSKDSTVNPSDIWNLDCNQKIKGIYNGWYADKDVELPKLVKEEKPVETPIVDNKDEKIKELEGKVLALGKENAKLVLDNKDLEDKLNGALVKLDTIKKIVG